mmetsp:Transcript_98912/g.317143  ORF Transcript_98912/g.317143 Transcript_98912/m.317143 type:complete len:215 (+) Transcript_98912:459-1103(+)
MLGRVSGARYHLVVRGGELAGQHWRCRLGEGGPRFGQGELRSRCGALPEDRRRQEHPSGCGIQTHSAHPRAGGKPRPRARRLPGGLGNIKGLWHHSHVGGFEGAVPLGLDAAVDGPGGGRVAEALGCLEDAAGPQLDGKFVREGGQEKYARTDGRAVSSVRGGNRRVPHQRQYCSAHGQIGCRECDQPNRRGCPSAVSARSRRPAVRGVLEMDL